MRAFLAGSILTIVVAGASYGCSGAGNPSSPTTITPVAAQSAGARFRALDEPPAGTPYPADGVPADGVPADGMPGDGMPGDGAIAPLPGAISIKSSLGSLAFEPNPLQALVGDMLVWTNNDLTLHHIVLEDGTDIGDILPGESSMPVPLTAPSTSYRCTIHPSMVGTVNRFLDPPPLDGDPSYGYSKPRAKRVRN